MSAKPIALIAIDLDGTLLTSSGELASESALGLKQAASHGVAVVVATTRNPHFAVPICRALGSTAPLICSNGAQVWGSPDGPVWAYRPIPREAAQAIAQFADENGWGLATTVDQTTYYRQRPGQALGRLTANTSVVANNSDAMTAAPLRILVWGDPAIPALRTYCEVTVNEACYTEIYLHADGSIDSLGIFARGADKGTALRLVLDRLKLDADQAVAFGDNLADLPMFAVAGTSVAMANAPDVVKQKASLVAPSNDDNGVAWGLARLNLNLG